MPIPDADHYSHPLPHASVLNADMSGASLVPQRAEVALRCCSFLPALNLSFAATRLAERAGNYND